jgi:hypothetical protein
MGSRTRLPGSAVFRLCLFVQAASEDARRLSIIGDPTDVYDAERLHSISNEISALLARRSQRFSSPIENASTHKATVGGTALLRDATPTHRSNAAPRGSALRIVKTTHQIDVDSAISPQCPLSRSNARRCIRMGGCCRSVFTTARRDSFITDDFLKV